MTFLATDAMPSGITLLSHALRPPASAAEWTQMRRIQRESLRDRHGNPYPAEPSRIDPDRLALVLLYRGTVVACLRLDRLGPNRVALRHVAVDPARRGEGHGAALIDLVEAYARICGASEVVLHAVASSVAFYQRLGYHPVRWDERAEHPTSVDLGKRLSVDFLDALDEGVERWSPRLAR